MISKGFNEGKSESLLETWIWKVNGSPGWQVGGGGQPSPSECPETTVVSLYLRSGSKLGAEKAMAPHSSTLAWKIPWTEEPGGLQSMGLLRVRHD